jgi:hypothetical protein
LLYNNVPGLLHSWLSGRYCCRYGCKLSCSSFARTMHVPRSSWGRRLNHQAKLSVPAGCSALGTRLAQSGRVLWSTTPDLFHYSR